MLVCSFLWAWCSVLLAGGWMDRLLRVVRHEREMTALSGDSLDL